MQKQRGRGGEGKGGKWKGGEGRGREGKGGERQGMTGRQEGHDELKGEEEIPSTAEVERRRLS